MGWVLTIFDWMPLIGDWAFIPQLLVVWIILLVAYYVAIAIAAKAPHPEAAKAFVDYWLSKESMKLLADQVGEYVLASGVFPPIDGIDQVKVLPIRELSDEETRKWGDEFKKIFFAN